MHLRDIVLSFDTYSNGASTSKRAGMRKAVWVGRSVDLQIKNEKLLQNFNFFQKQKPVLLQKKEERQFSLSSFCANRILFKITTGTAYPIHTYQLWLHRQFVAKGQSP